jgi:hypothetical protein
MIGVLVGHQNGIQVGGVDPNSGKALKQFSGGQTSVDEETGFSRLHED